MKPHLSNSGYLFVNLAIPSVNGKRTKQEYIHRLVALAFIPNPKNLPQVNHKDRNKRNNSVDNLEWVTQEENCNHYRECKSDVRTKTSGCFGTLYENTTPVKRFRSIIQAKKFCKTRFNCSLTFCHGVYVNIAKRVLYVLDGSPKTAEDIWVQIKEDESQYLKEQMALIQSQKGFRGIVTDTITNKVIGTYNSIREANEALSCNFKKKGAVYKALNYQFVKEA